MILPLDKDLELELKEDPEVLESLPFLIRQQIELEKWRKKRFSADTRSRVKRLIKEATKCTDLREEAAQKLEEATEAISTYFEQKDV